MVLIIEELAVKTMAALRTPEKSKNHSKTLKTYKDCSEIFLEVQGFLDIA